MLTIFSNNTGTPIISAPSLDVARLGMTHLDCSPYAVFGDGILDFTVLDTGPETAPDLPPLHQSRKFYPRVAARGIIRA